MIDQDWIKRHNEGEKPGVLGVISIGGYPGHYTLRAGVSGSVIASGSMGEIQSALGMILKPGARR